MKRALLLFVAALPALAADALAPEIAVPESFRYAPATDASKAPELRYWWRKFGDAELDSLIDRALRNNPDLKIAASRVAQARSMQKIAHSGLLPSVDANTSFQRIRGGYTQGIVHVGNSATNFVAPFETPLYQGGFDASWELDFFGARRNASKAATLDATASEESRRDAQLTVIAEVARNYAELRGIDERLDIANRNVVSQRTSLELIRARVEGGLATDLDVERQAAQLATTEATIPALDAARAQTSQRIAVLLGEQPSALEQELAKAGELPKTPIVSPVGLPSELLTRRPDVREALDEIAAQAARVGVAKADLWPKVTLTGFAGRQGTSFGGLTLGGGNFFGVGPAVTLPIFTGGRTRANIAFENQRWEEARLRYQRTVLNALEEAEDSMVAYAREQDRAQKLAVAVEASKRSVELSTELYTRGLSDFLSVLDAQSSQLAAEDELAQSKTADITQLIAVYKALGGGWD